MNTKIIFISTEGREMTHSLGARVTRAYAMQLFQDTILASQGVLSPDAKRTSKFRLVEIKNTLD